MHAFVQARAPLLVFPVAAACAVVLPLLLLLCFVAGFSISATMLAPVNIVGRVALGALTLFVSWLAAPPARTAMPSLACDPLMPMLARHRPGGLHGLAGREHRCGLEGALSACGWSLGVCAQRNSGLARASSQGKRSNPKSDLWGTRTHTARLGRAPKPNAPGKEGRAAIGRGWQRARSLRPAPQRCSRWRQRS